jgi:hypothetical protein
VDVRGGLRLCGLGAAIAAAALACAHDSGRASRTAPSECRSSYDYAGAQGARARSGIRANVRTVKAPRVAVGHVAGWLGVGGPGLGPGGTDEWLQIGYSAFESGVRQVYYEVTLPRKAPRYHTVDPSLANDEVHRLAVLEVGGKPGSWRAWVDDRAVSPVFLLAGSHDRFKPQALGESWNGTSRRCNSYGYAFAAIESAARPGGQWQSAAGKRPGYQWENAEQQVVRTSPDSFVVRSAASARAATVDEPPLLGRLASTLLGRPVTARCAAQRAPARERPAGVLRLSTSVCEVLVGYAVAEPWVPKAGTAAGLEVAQNALGFLRGISRAGRAPRVDCRAVGFFYRTMRGLCATQGQALALRNTVIRARARVVPPLSLPPGCPIR